MDKAKLPEVQWQVGDKGSLDTAAKVEPQHQHLARVEM